MTQTKRLQAAIDKIDSLKRDEKWGPAFGIVGNAVQAQTPSDQWRFITSEIDRADADLIVILHRTITAQLTILRTALAGAIVHRDSNIESLAAPYIQNGLTLADAILGTTALAEEAPESPKSEEAARG